jgi:hypothetical protein
MLFCKAITLLLSRRRRSLCRAEGWFSMLRNDQNTNL